MKVNIFLIFCFCSNLAFASPFCELTEQSMEKNSGFQNGNYVFENYDVDMLENEFNKKTIDELLLDCRLDLNNKEKRRASAFINLSISEASRIKERRDRDVNRIISHIVTYGERISESLTKKYTYEQELPSVREDFENNKLAFDMYIDLAFDSCEAHEIIGEKSFRQGNQKVSNKELLKALCLSDIKSEADGNMFGEGFSFSVLDDVGSKYKYRDWWFDIEDDDGSLYVDDFYAPGSKKLVDGIYAFSKMVVGDENAKRARSELYQNQGAIAFAHLVEVLNKNESAFKEKLGLYQKSRMKFDNLNGSISSLNEDVDRYESFISKLVLEAERLNDERLNSFIENELEFLY